MSKQEYERPVYRPLKVFSSDPSLGRAGTMTLNSPYEDLAPGPVSDAIAVVDYDATNDCFYPPVDLNNPAVLVSGGLDPSESDPRFHQQMAYAVVRETMQRFKFALGRSTKWNRGVGDRLRIYPHAMQEANAYYSRELKAILFGYFRASESDPGDNLPGQVVFTCLSHDVIAHETTHAIIDGQKSFFLERTSKDTPAFHEAFADIVALFLHFTQKDALLDTIQRTGGLIYRPEIAPGVTPGSEGAIIGAELGTGNPLVDLARQFGEAMGMRKALRAALGTPPNSRLLPTLGEPHDRGSILVAAVFDAYFSVYVKRTRDLMRIAGLSSSQPAQEIPPELANRLAGEAMKAAEHFCNICIRALDYCPPVDVQFGDFLRAIITSDYDLVPDDPLGYRAAIIEAFRSRGICPEGVVSYAEDSLRWSPPNELGSAPLVCDRLRFDLVRSPTDREQEKTAQRLHAFADAHKRELGLTDGVPIQIFSFHPVARIAPDGHLKVEIVAEIMQKYDDVPLDPSDSSSPTFTFRGGTTVVLNAEGEVLYGVHKPLGANDAANVRLAKQRDYYSQVDDSLAAATYSSTPAGASSRPISTLDDPHSTLMRFDLIHRGF